MTVVIIDRHYTNEREYVSNSLLHQHTHTKTIHQHVKWQGSIVK